MMIICLAIFDSAEAQIFKKIKDKVEKSAEESIVNKTEKKASKVIDKNIDDALEGEIHQKENTNRQSAQKSKQDLKVRDQYVFHRKIDMEIQAEGQTMMMETYINENENYSGIKISQGMEMMSISDPENNLSLNLMENAGQKIAQKSKLNQGDNEDLGTFEVEDLPDKTIMGYNCKGKRVESEKVVMKIYYTSELGFGFNALDTNPDQIPESLKDEFNFEDEYFMMSMDMTVKSGEKIDAKMRCKNIEKVELTYNISDYKFY
ncbi:MAG: hypothetical protein ABR595_08175 [Psychroflexus sp.]